MAGGVATGCGTSGPKNGKTICQMNVFTSESNPTCPHRQTLIFAMQRQQHEVSSGLDWGVCSKDLCEFSGIQVGRKWDGSGTEVGRKWDGRGTEVGGKRDGSGMEVGRKRDGRGTEVGRKWDGRGTEVGRMWTEVGFFQITKRRTPAQTPTKHF